MSKKGVEVFKTTLRYVKVMKSAILGSFREEG